MTDRRELSKLMQENFPDYPVQDCEAEDTPRIFDTCKASFKALLPLPPLLQGRFAGQAQGSSHLCSLIAPNKNGERHFVRPALQRSGAHHPVDLPRVRPDLVSN